MNLVTNAAREAEVIYNVASPLTTSFAEPVSETTSVASTKVLYK